MPPPEQLASLVIGLVLVLLFFLVISAVVAAQAHQRGYRFLPWLIAGTLGNPVFFLVLLAIMPDYARKARRRQELADLEQKLAARPRVLPPAPRPPADDARRERSLGDLPTELPPARSLGEEETRA
jgi:hypothetical protein